MKTNDEHTRKTGPDPDVLAAPEMEEAVLGLCLRRPGDVLPRVAAELGLDAFTKPAHQEVWATMLEMQADPGCQIDLLTLTRKLHDKGVLERAGGAAGITALHEAFGVAGMLDQYLPALAEKTARRRIRSVAARTAEAALDTTVPVGDVVGEAQGALLDVVGQAGDRKALDGKGMAAAAVDWINRCYKRRGKTTGGPAMGFKELDHVFQGFHPECLYLLAGRPAMGKSALAMNLAENLSLAGVPTLIFSLEMSATDLGVRWVLGGADVDIQKARTGMLSRPEMQSVLKIGAQLAGSPLICYDQPALSLADVSGRVRMHVQRNRTQVVFIDYIQLIRGVTRRARENRYLEVAEVAQGLKNLAKEMKISIVATAQLGRGPEERRDKRPMLSDLRESGDLEQAADAVMAIYRPGYYDQDRPQNEARVCVLKNRMGPANAEGIELTWVGDRVRFLDQKAGERMYDA